MSEHTYPPVAFTLQPSGGGAWLIVVGNIAAGTLRKLPGPWGYGIYLMSDELYATAEDPFEDLVRFTAAYAYHAAADPLLSAHLHGSGVADGKTGPEGER